MKSVVAILLCGLFVTSLQSGAQSEVVKTDHADQIHMADLSNVISTLREKLCGELFTPQAKSSQAEFLSKKPFEKPCAMIRSSKDYDQALATTASACVESCKKSADKCAEATCVEVCDNEAQAGELAKTIHIQDEALTEKETLEGRMNAYLKVLCEDLYSAEKLNKKNDKRSYRKELQEQGRFRELAKDLFKDFEKAYRDYKGGDIIYKSNAKDLAQKYKSHRTFKEDCLNAKNADELQAILNKAMNVCEMNCEAQAKALEAKLKQPAAASGRPMSQQKVAADDTDLSPKCVSNACKVRCADQQRAGVLANKIFSQGLGDSL